MRLLVANPSPTLPMIIRVAAVQLSETLSIARASLFVRNSQPCFPFQHSSLQSFSSSGIPVVP